jgi:hypothetical protein
VCTTKEQPSTFVEGSINTIFGERETLILEKVRLRQAFEEFFDSIEMNEYDFIYWLFPIDDALLFI